MDQTHINYIRRLNRLLLSLLALLGFTNCGKIGAEEYGTPYAEYSIKGKVKSPEGTGIPDIKISAVRDEPNARDTCFTTKSDEAGNYSMEYSNFPSSDWLFVAEDVDGEANGSFEKQEQEVSLQSDDFKGSDGWFEGKVDKQVDFQLKERAKNE